MTTFLVRQKLANGDDTLRQHLVPLASFVADSLENPNGSDVAWICGFADVETNEFFMLFEAPNEETLRERIQHIPEFRSATRVIYANRENIGLMYLKVLARSDKER